MKTTMIALVAELLVLTAFIAGLYSLIRKDFKLYKKHVVHFEEEEALSRIRIPLEKKQREIPPR